MEYQKNKERVFSLIKRGVNIHNPSTVDIGDEVDIERFSPSGVIIYSGCKIYGKNTLIMSGAQLGYEAPVTIEDCQIGQNVELKGGYFNKSVFLRNSSMGSCSQVREGCILEEEANAAHAVGLKHTILFPFVTIGSLINFCDCLMAGGTSRKNHSEVGSSYVHFNYTPQQDKATPSLIGDVPGGVMLDQPPIFLGGQGGLVGPSRLDFGTVIAAGLVFRGDVLEENRFISAQPDDRKNLNFYPGVYRNIQRRILNNINYCSQLIALKNWYIHVRFRFFQRIPLGAELYQGALEKLDLALEERIKRVRELVYKCPYSIEKNKEVGGNIIHHRVIEQMKEIVQKWEVIEGLFQTFKDMDFDSSEKAFFIGKIESAINERGCEDYIEAIQGLKKEERAQGTKWLKGIVDDSNKQIIEELSSFSSQF